MTIFIAPYPKALRRFTIKVKKLNARMELGESWTPAQNGRLVNPTPSLHLRMPCANFARFFFRMREQIGCEQSTVC